MLCMYNVLIINLITLIIKHSILIQLSTYNNCLNGFFFVYSNYCSVVNMGMGNRKITCNV